MTSRSRSRRDDVGPFCANDPSAQCGLRARRGLHGADPVWVVLNIAYPFNARCYLAILGASVLVLHEKADVWTLVGLGSSLMVVAGLIVVVALSPTTHTRSSTDGRPVRSRRHRAAAA